MIESVLKAGLDAGFSVTEAFQEKLEKKEYESRHAAARSCPPVAGGTVNPGFDVHRYSARNSPPQRVEPNKNV
jgi:hypothetical protein